MKLHEYQAKKLLTDAGLPVPAGKMVASANDVPAALAELGFTRGVVKAQAYTGGRGKAGGVKLFQNEAEAKELTDQMIGMTLVTHQTGPEGVGVDSVLLEDASEIVKEFYLAFLLDRALVSPVIMISPDGGMDIEEVAMRTPERILKLYPSIGKPLSEQIKSDGAEFLNLNEKQTEQFGVVLDKLYIVFQERDASLLEINPLILNGAGELAILDCKFDIDDNALFRQKDTGGDPNGELTPAEIDAAEYNMSYISLDGDIGCMVNGAGLAMATMDTITHFGASPANFLDVGGSANEEAVAKAFDIISSDGNVKAILVNIFGGIMKCDTIATGIINAVKSTGLAVPLIVRLEGTNVEKGKELIDNSGLNIISADSLADGAEKAVAAIK